MAGASNVKVHLDHLIQRESLRWVDAKPDTPNPVVAAAVTRNDSLTKLSYQDIDDRDKRLKLFALLRKPDFQRETSAWTPEECVELLESIVDGLIVPSLIVWRSPENNFVYLLDGAHRVSVLRAWITDDWGDKAPEGYYERNEYEGDIREAARKTRELVRFRLGAYTDVVAAGEKYFEVMKRGRALTDELNDTEQRRAQFYIQVLRDIGFHVQEVQGTYETAETSFLKINRSGQPLADWETTLIQNRNSSFARSVMSLANGGAGRYWPEMPNEPAMQSRRTELCAMSADIHRVMFVPPITTPIKDANVPFVAATRYFPKHAYLMELLPVIEGMYDPSQLFERDNDAPAATILDNGYKLLDKVRLAFQHLSGASNDPLSLSIVPLFYFYVKSGRYVRSGLYGFIAWLMAGTEEDIRNRKIIFSAHRGRFEQVIFENDIQGPITRRAGSGVKGIPGTVQFYQELTQLLVDDPAEPSNHAFQKRLDDILKRLTKGKADSGVSESRNYDERGKTTINLRELFKSAVRCEICGGVLDLRRGVQYDHAMKFSETRVTDVKTGRPTHPFCNNMRDSIEGYRAGKLSLKLPPSLGLTAPTKADGQLSFLSTLFEGTTFPDES